MDFDLYFHLFLFLLSVFFRLSANSNLKTNSIATQKNIGDRTIWKICSFQPTQKNNKFQENKRFVVFWSSSIKFLFLFLHFEKSLLLLHILKYHFAIYFSARRYKLMLFTNWLPVRRWTTDNAWIDLCAQFKRNQFCRKKQVRWIDSKKKNIFACRW